MKTSRSKVQIEEAEDLITAIRAGVLVHAQDGVRPDDLRDPLDSARVVNSIAVKIGNEKVATAADALEAWLMLLAAETEPISHTRTRSLLDQISELEAALIAHKAATQPPALDVAGFVDESFRTISPTPMRRKTDRKPEVRTDEFELDAEMLEVFRDESESLLQDIRTNLRMLSSRPNDRDVLWKIKKAAHTFKGSAGIVGLGRSSGLAHRIEDLLEQLSEKSTSADSQIVSLLLDAADCLEELSRRDASPGLDDQLETLNRRFDGTLTQISERPVSRPSTAMRSDDSGYPTEKRRNGIVRVSVDRLDDLVRNVRDLVSSRLEFERHMEQLAQQIDEASNNTLRLQAASGKLSKLDEIAPDASSLSHYGSELEQSAYELEETAGDAATINSSLGAIKSSLGDISSRQRDLLEHLRERLMRLRNVEFGTIATRLQRTVGVTCEDEGKKAEVIIENGSVEVDTQVIDLLIEPLMHLLKNAVVHGIETPEIRRIIGKPEMGTITIGITNDSKTVQLTVSDDGRGIAFQPLVDKAVALGLITRSDADRMLTAQFCDLIFLPGLTTAEKLTVNAGRGVGMSIVRESIIAAHGTISVETSPQKGTTFKVRVPVPFSEMNSPDGVEEFQLPNSEADSLTVLIVDDSPSVRLMTSRTIKKVGWQVESAKNGIDALERLNSMDALPGAILTDIEMPRMGGYEFLATLRSDPSLKDIPVIILSSRAGSENRDQAIAAGAVEYITKPYNEHSLIEIIDSVALHGELVGAD